MHAQPQVWLTQAYQGVFENVLLYLAAKLDALQDADGGTVLDNSLLVWSQECCIETHKSYSIPVVTFGSAGGYFTTGLYCDYRKMGDSASAISPEDIPSYTTYFGVLYSQWLANVLQGMGVPPAEFELWKDANGNVQHGYGTAYVSTMQCCGALVDQSHYQNTASPYFTGASGPLPFIKA
jgi:hypothetical protein